VAGSCEHDTEPWGSMKGGKFFDRLKNYEYVLFSEEGYCSVDLLIIIIIIITVVAAVDGLRCGWSGLNSC